MLELEEMGSLERIEILMKNNLESRIRSFIIIFLTFSLWISCSVIFHIFLGKRVYGYIFLLIKQRNYVSNESYSMSMVLIFFFLNYEIFGEKISRIIFSSFRYYLLVSERSREGITIPGVNTSKHNGRYCWMYFAFPWKPDNWCFFENFVVCLYTHGLMTTRTKKTLQRF